MVNCSHHNDRLPPGPDQPRIVSGVQRRYLAVGRRPLLILLDLLLAASLAPLYPSHPHPIRIGRLTARQHPRGNPHVGPVPDSGDFRDHRQLDRGHLPHHRHLFQFLAHEKSRDGRVDELQLGGLLQRGDPQCRLLFGSSEESLHGAGDRNRPSMSR